MEQLIGRRPLVEKEEGHSRQGALRDWRTQRRMLRHRVKHQAGRVPTEETRAPAT